MPFKKISSASPVPASSTTVPDPAAAQTDRAWGLRQRFGVNKVAQETPQEIKKDAVPQAQSASEQGRKGGLSRSDKKARAARRNGRKGGRKPTRTLAERLLGQKLTYPERQEINKGWGQNQFLLASEAQALLEFFGANWAIVEVPFDTSVWHRKTGRTPKKIRYLIAKFRLSARHLLDAAKAKPVKDYVVAYREPSPEECVAWEYSHPDMPCPPRPVRNYFRDLPLYNFVVKQVEANPYMTAAELRELGGGAYSGPVAPALLKYLRAINGG
jgi:hypothetical protein